MTVPGSFGVSAALERALGADDPSLAALSEAERRAASAVWLYRAESEMTAAVGFKDLTRDLFAAPAAPEVRWLAVRAAADEMRHSEICRRVAERYLGSSPPLPAPRRYEAARFGDCPEELNRTLRVVLQSCISETIGSAVLKELLDEAKGPLARAALRDLLRDEINHARIGYAHLSSAFVGSEHREHVRRALPTLLELARRAWLEGGPAVGAVPEGHGSLGARAVAGVVEDAISNLVVPGLEAVL